MTITVRERWDSRAATERERCERLYTINGTDDDILAHEALNDIAPIVYRGMKRQKTSIEPIAPGAWAGTVPYAPIEPLEIDTPVFEFDTGSGTEHRTHSIQTMGAYAPPGETAPDFGGLINVTKSGVDGVDIDAPAFRGTIRIALEPEDYNQVYVVTLAGMAKKVNDAPFYGWQAGEVRFDSGTVTYNASDRVELLLNFLINANATGLSVGTITGIVKEGWDYLWVLSGDFEDEASHQLVKRPIAAYVERMYYRANFAVLGVGA